jgi:hypothetical protein
MVINVSRTLILKVNKPYNGKNLIAKIKTLNFWKIKRGSWVWVIQLKKRR